MGDYACVRVWQLKPGASAADVETLASSSLLEMQRWIPGVKRLSLLRAGEREAGGSVRYIMTLTFTDYKAYMYWRQMEEEASDFWERYAAVSMHWEQLSLLIDEYAGELVVDGGLVGDVRS